MPNEPVVNCNTSYANAGYNFSTVSALAGVLILNPQSGILVYVSQVDDYYRLLLTSSATVDNFNFLSTSLGGATRWMKCNWTSVINNRPVPKLVSGAFNILSTDGDFWVDVSGEIATGTLPTNPIQWEYHLFKDYNDACSANAITLNAGANTIEQPGAPGNPPASTLVLGNGGFYGNGIAITLQWDGNIWNIF